MTGASDELPVASRRHAGGKMSSQRI